MKPLCVLAAFVLASTPGAGASIQAPAVPAEMQSHFFTVTVNGRAAGD